MPVKPAGRVPLADGRKAKLVTGIDDHSRFAVLATVVAVPPGRTVCEAFVAAMGCYGVPAEVLSDNGKLLCTNAAARQCLRVLMVATLRDEEVRSLQPCQATRTASRFKPLGTCWWAQRARSLAVSDGVRDQ
jgi:hypothetical protein